VTNAPTSSFRLLARDRDAHGLQLLDGGGLRGYTDQRFDGLAAHLQTAGIGTVGAIRDGRAGADIRRVGDVGEVDLLVRAGLQFSVAFVHQKRRVGDRRDFRNHDFGLLRIGERVVKPSSPRFGPRSDNSRGSVPLNGESRSSSVPFTSKCTIDGQYSSETQNVPSVSATRPSVSSP
jgi:hypothetical protein